MGCNDDMTFKVFGDHLLYGMEHGHSNSLHLGYIKTYSILIAKKRGVDATFLGRYLPPMPIAILLGSLGWMVDDDTWNIINEYIYIPRVNGGWWYVEYYQWRYIYIYRRIITYVWLYIILWNITYNCKECWYPKLDPNERFLFYINYPSYSLWEFCLSQSRVSPYKGPCWHMRKSIHPDPAPN